MVISTQSINLLLQYHAVILRPTQGNHTHQTSPGSSYTVNNTTVKITAKICRIPATCLQTDRHADCITAHPYEGECKVTPCVNWPPVDESINELCPAESRGKVQQRQVIGQQVNINTSRVGPPTGRKVLHVTHKLWLGVVTCLEISHIRASMQC